MKASRAPIRWRFFAAGAGAILTAILLGGAIDRTLVLNEVAPQIRFAASAGVMLVLLVVPLMLSLERWVIRPLEALEGLHDTKRKHDRSPLSERDLPQEMAEVIGHHTEMLSSLHDANERLQAEVKRRTEALEVIVSAADALSRMHPGSPPAEVLLPHVAQLDVGCAAALVHRADGRWVATVLPPGPIDSEEMEKVEDRIGRLLGQGQRLRIDWLPPIVPGGEPVQNLRVLVRQPLDPDASPPSPAALVLLSARPSSGSPAGDDLRRVVSTLGTWVARVRPSSFKKA
jgi:hypothetical protein